MNENLLKIYNKNSFTNRERKRISLNYSKKHFQKFSFPKIKKLLYEQSKYNKADDDELNDYSHSNKKTLTSLSNNDIIKANNAFTTKKTLIDKNEIEKMIMNNTLKREKYSSLAFEFKKEDKSLGLLEKNSSYINKNDFPDISSNTNKSSFAISSYKTKSQAFRRQSLPQKQNIFLSSKISNNTHKPSNRIKSSKNNYISSPFGESIKKKCHYLILQLNEKEKKKKKDIYKLNVDEIVKAINGLLLQNDKTFEILEELINDRIKNKESTKQLDEKLINYESELSQNKVLQSIFLDIIKKIYRQILKNSYKYNNLTTKNEIKNEYFNKMNNIKEFLNVLKIKKEKNFLKNIKTNSAVNIKNNKNIIKIKLKTHKKLNINPSLFEKDENNKIMNNISKKEKIKKYKSNDDVIFHFYNFNEASNEIEKQNLLKGPLINKMKDNFLSSFPLNSDYLKKIKFNNNFVKKRLEQKKIKSKKKIDKNNYEKNLYDSAFFIKNNNKSLKYLLNNNKFENEKDSYSILNLKIYENKNNMNLNFQNNNNNNNIKNNEQNNDKYKENKNDYNNNDKNNNNLNEIISSNKKFTHFLINNKNIKIEEKIYFKDKYQSIENTNQKQNKNEDIINYIQSPIQKENKEKSTIPDNIKKLEEKSEKFEKLPKIRLKIYAKTNIYPNKYNSKNLNKLFLNESTDESKSFQGDKSSSSFSFDSPNILKVKKHRKSNKKIKESNKSLNSEGKHPDKRNIKRFNTISFVKINNKSFFNSKNNILFDSLNLSPYKRSSIKDLNNNIHIENEGKIRRRHSISQNYLQLFFKNKLVKENKSKRQSFIRRRFKKRKTTKELTFKEFLQKEKEEYYKIEEEKPEIKNEEIQGSIWEDKFNQFKDYVHKLKEMSNDEFIKDTFKFIKKDEE